MFEPKAGLGPPATHAQRAAVEVLQWLEAQLQRRGD